MSSSPAAKSHATRQFLLLCLALLAVTFALWTALGHAVAMPVVGFVNMFLQWWMPELVQAVVAEEQGAMLVSSLGEFKGRILPAGDSGGNLAFYINTMGLSYSLPFYAALFFATPREDYAGPFFRGCLILYAMLFLGLISVGLKDLMINLGPAFRAQGVPFLPPNDVIAIFYQLNSLIIPTLVPAAIWIWQSQDTAVLQGLLPEQPPKEESDF